MKQRLMKNWTIRRVVYLLIGATIMTQALASAQWPAIFIGGYFAAMGLFAFGCAGRSCSVNDGRQNRNRLQPTKLNMKK